MNRNAVAFLHPWIHKIAKTTFSDLKYNGFENELEATKFISNETNVPRQSFGIIGNAGHWAAWSKNINGELITHEWNGKFFGVIEWVGIKMPGAIRCAKIYNFFSESHRAYSVYDIEFWEGKSAAGRAWHESMLNNFGIPVNRLQKYHDILDLDNITDRIAWARSVARVTECSRDELDKMDAAQLSSELTWPYVQTPASSFPIDQNLKNWDDWIRVKKKNKIRATREFYEFNGFGGG